VSAKRDNLLGVRLSDEEMDALTRASEETMESRQGFLRAILRRALGLKTSCDVPVH